MVGKRVLGEKNLIVEIVEKLNNRAN